MKPLDRINCGRAWATGTLTFITDAAPTVDTVTTSLEAAGTSVLKTFNTMRRCRRDGRMNTTTPAS